MLTTAITLRKTQSSTQINWFR